MTDYPRIAPTLEAEMPAADYAWLSGLNWADAAVPSVAGPADAERYARVEAALNRAMKGASFAERAESAEGRMAAAIGARLADWRERDEAVD